MTIYLDESGDLGFGHGGSLYFAITFIATKEPIKLEKAVRKIKQKFNLPLGYELKGSKLKIEIKQKLLYILSQMDIDICSIIMNKSNVIPRLQSDTNILYNYLLGLILVPYLKEQCKEIKEITIRVDRRIVSVKSGFKLDDYLAYKVWYENQIDLNMQLEHQDSRYDLGIQVADIICNSIFKKYESQDIKLYDLIKHRIKEERLLFF